MGSIGYGWRRAGPITAVEMAATGRADPRRREPIPTPLAPPLGSPTPERQRDPSNHPASPSPDMPGVFGPPVMRRGGATADAGADLTASAEAHCRRLERAAGVSRGNVP